VIMNIIKLDSMFAEILMMLADMLVIFTILSIKFYNQYAIILLEILL
jgi:hypothetical protein